MCLNNNRPSKFLASPYFVSGTGPDALQTMERQKLTKFLQTDVFYRTHDLATRKANGFFCLPKIMSIEDLTKVLIRFEQMAH